MKSSEIIKMLEEDGWYWTKRWGATIISSTFENLEKLPSSTPKDVPPKTLGCIMKQAG